MSDVIEELADEAEGRINAGHVRRRVADWQSRVRELYDRIVSWLPADVSAVRESSLPMREKMMEHYGVAEVRVPVLELRDSGEWIGKMVPRGLWIIGANGRLDLFVRGRHFLVIDRAQNFEAPEWMIAPSADRRRERKLDASAFLQAIGR